MNFYNGLGYFELEKYKQTTSILSDALAYRWHVLTGADPTFRPEIQSVSRLNFEILSLRKVQERERHPRIREFLLLTKPASGTCLLPSLPSCSRRINQSGV